MIHIKYKLDRSSIHGIGVFANQDIKKGDVIFTASPLDVNITQDKFDQLEEAEKQEVRYWGFWVESKKMWHVDFDHIHFINHSFSANTTQDFSHPEAYLIASRDIKKGEELTQNYLEFETAEDLKRRGITNSQAPDQHAPNNLDKQVEGLIKDRVLRIRGRLGKKYLRYNLLYPEQQRDKDLEQVKNEIKNIQNVHFQMKNHIKGLRKFIPDITEETILCASYLIFGKVIQTWETIFVLCLKGYNFDVMELIRSIGENLDLIKTFHLDSDQKYLKQWFGGQIITHDIARRLEEKFIKKNNQEFLEKHNLSPYDMATDIYRTFSKYTHCSYAALLDSVDVFNEDFDWNGYAGAHYTLHNIHALRSAMSATLTTLKVIYLQLKDMEKYSEIDKVLTDFAGPIDENVLNDLIRKIAS